MYNPNRISVMNQQQMIVIGGGTGGSTNLHLNNNNNSAVVRAESISSNNLMMNAGGMSPTNNILYGVSTGVIGGNQGSNNLNNGQQVELDSRVDGAGEPIFDPIIIHDAKF